MIQLNPRYEAIFKKNHIFHQPSYILPMNIEADFIKEVLDAELYKQTARITSDFIHPTSSFVLRIMVFLHILISINEISQYEIRNELE